MPEVKPCRHCGKRACRPKQLCWNCSLDPAIRTQYATLSKFGVRRPVVDKVGGHELPRPTPALPATASKVAEMERRAALGLALFHPLDGVATDTIAVPGLRGGGQKGEQEKRRRKRMGKVRVVWQPPRYKGPIIEGSWALFRDM